MQARLHRLPMSHGEEENLRNNNFTYLSSFLLNLSSFFVHPKKKKGPLFICSFGLLGRGKGVPGGGGGGGGESSGGMRRSGAIMAWNVFRFCTALRGLGSIMILLVLAVVGVTYYAVVVTNYGALLLGGGLEDMLVSVAVLVPFHGMLVMLLWSYFSVVITDPGIVPPNWKPTVDEETGEAVPLTSSDFGNQILTLQQSEALAGQANPRIRYCRKCNQPKPPRCHHCSVCGRCVLKMDHHCVWVVNCVGALNYKFFLLFLFYTFLETTLVTISLLPNFIAFFNDGEIPATPGTLATTFLAFVLNLAFALSVLGFLIMHISLVGANTTTIEAYEKKTNPKWRYDIGRRRNFEQVFGTDKKHWFVPSYSDEDLRRMPALQGLEYPSKPHLDSQEF